mmetsp:Transcript_5488/g.11977  ORF Transcript_5488/g.11977 Transcript_5488/m.11977 type:complete len:104 (-) Transcript_5488:62-373(-)
MHSISCRCNHSLPHSASLIKPIIAPTHLLPSFPCPSLDGYELGEPEPSTYARYNYESTTFSFVLLAAVLRCAERVQGLLDAAKARKSKAERRAKKKEESLELV